MATNELEKLFGTNRTTHAMLSSFDAPLEEYFKRKALVDSIVDGDTIGGQRLVGVDSMESVGFDANNEKAQKILDEYGISFEDQAHYGKLAKEQLKEKIMSGNYTLGKVGTDAYGRPLVYNKRLNEDLLATGLYAPTDRYDKKSQDLFRKAQEKTARINAKQAEFMEAQRQYNIEGQNPGLIRTMVTDPIDALQSGTQQLVAGTGDFLLDVITPGNNTWLDEAKSAESADKTWGYDRRESQFQQDEMMDDWHKGNYASSLGTAALLAPEVIGESLPMMASMMTPTGLGRAAIAGVGAKALGATAKAAKAEGAIREANALGKFAKSMTDDGFMLAVGTTTNNHIDEFTANNGGVGPSYGEIARMTAINALQLGTDKFAFQDIVGVGNVPGFIKAMKPMTKVVPEGVLGSIATGVARTAMAMGEEAGQEYFQTWAEILNGQLGTTKYGSMQNILANEQNQDEALLGGILGASAGGAMHVGSKPFRMIGDKLTANKEENERRNAAREEMYRQVINGELDLDNNPISYSGEGKKAAQQDLLTMASRNDGRMAAVIANAAVLPEVDIDNVISNIDKSLRTAFNGLGDTLGGSDTAIDEVLYQDATYKIALSSIAQLEKAGREQGMDVTPQMEAILQSYSRILSPERFGQLHLNLLGNSISELQTAGMNDSINQGSDAADQIGTATKAYKVSIDDIKATVAKLQAREDSIRSAIKGSYGGTTSGGSDGGSGFGSINEALNVIKDFKDMLIAKVAEADKAGSKYTEFTGSPYDALKSKSQVANEILIKGKTGADGIHGKGLIQHGLDISEDIIAAARKGGKIEKSNLASFLNFVNKRFKKSNHVFHASDLSGQGDFKDTFIPRTKIFTTEAETGLAKKAYASNYHPDMDVTDATAKSKLEEAQYMLKMIENMIALLKASEDKLDPKSYKETMDKLVEARDRQLEDIAELDVIIAAKDDKPSDYIAVSINKYLDEKKEVPKNMKALVEQFKREKSAQNIADNQFYYVYVPRSYFASGAAETSGGSNEQTATTMEDDFADAFYSEDADSVMLDENGNEMTPSGGSDTLADGSAEAVNDNNSESEDEANVGDNTENKPDNGQVEPQTKGTDDGTDEGTTETNERGGEGEAPDEAPTSNESSEGTEKGNEEPKQGTEEPVTTDATVDETDEIAVATPSKSTKKPRKPYIYRGLTNDQITTLENSDIFNDETGLAEEIARLREQNRLDKEEIKTLDEVLQEELREWQSREGNENKTLDDFFAEEIAKAEEAVKQANIDLNEDMLELAREHGLDYAPNEDAHSISENLKAFRSAVALKIKELKGSAKKEIAQSLDRIGKLSQVLNAIVRGSEWTLEGKGISPKEGVEFKPEGNSDLQEASKLNKLKSESTLKSDADKAQINAAQSRIERAKKKLADPGISDNTRAKLLFSIQKDTKLLKDKSTYHEAGNAFPDVVRTSSTESTKTAEPKEQSEPQKKDVKPNANVNIFASFGSDKDTKAKIDAIDVKIKALDDELWDAKKKIAKDYVITMKAEAMRAGKLEFDPDKAKERDEKWFKEGLAKAEKEMKGC